MNREQFAKDFAEYISQNHYSLYNVSNNVCYWRSEDDEKNTDELLEEFTELYKSIISEYQNTTPKEKAEELVEKFKQESFAQTEHFKLINAKECAMLYVDEVLDLKLEKSDYYFYSEVKHEILKL